jgi:broad specificity phosphatase PhoE
MASKTIHLVRHAQGYHNLTTANHHLPDPLLTPLGESQCRSLSTIFPFPPSSTSVVIAASPLKRTIYTALLSFAPLIRNRGLKIIALPEVQETSDLPCDTGSKIEELHREFKDKPVDLSLVEKVGNSWISKNGPWAPSADAIEKRARSAREWLYQRQEEVAIVVTHGGFLHYFTEDWSGSNRFQGMYFSIYCQRLSDLHPPFHTIATAGF